MSVYKLNSANYKILGLRLSYEQQFVVRPAVMTTKGTIRVLISAVLLVNSAELYCSGNEIGHSCHYSIGQNQNYPGLLPLSDLKEVF